MPSVAATAEKAQQQPANDFVEIHTIIHHSDVKHHVM
jgi:hypothetical protein